MIDHTEYDTCALCPKLCRHTCPVAVGSGREAGTPTSMMSGPWALAMGHGTEQAAIDLASLCTRCDACTQFCKLNRPVADLLRGALETLTGPAQVEPIGPITGTGDMVAVHSDDRDWAQALSKHINEPVAQLSTRDHLGVALLDHRSHSEAHLQSLAERVAGRTLVVSDHACFQVAEAAGVPTKHLHTMVPAPDASSLHFPCHGPQPTDEKPPPDALSCCGAGGPLSQQHPHIAAEVGRSAAQRIGPDPAFSPDCRCARWLNTHGANVQDPISVLLNLSAKR